MISKERIKELAAEASTLDGIGAAPYREVIRAIERALAESAKASSAITHNEIHGSTEARNKPARSSVSNAGGAQGQGPAADTGTPPNTAENVEAGGSPATSSASPASAREKPCETCNDDPAVCATVPGLRHCEAAIREPQTTGVIYFAKCANPTEKRGYITWQVWRRDPQGQAWLCDCASEEYAAHIAKALTAFTSPTRAMPICKDHIDADWNQPTLDDDSCILCRLFYLEAQEGLLEAAQQRAERAEDAIKDMERPLDAQMARLNAEVTRLNVENELLRSAASRSATPRADSE